MKMYVVRGSEKSVKKIVDEVITNPFYENIGVVELNTVEDILNFAKKAKSEIVIDPTNDFLISGETVPVITIYDYYLE